MSYTNNVELVNTEYRLITSKLDFLMQHRGGNASVSETVEIIASATLPGASDTGVIIDARQGLQRSFAGNVYGRSTGAQSMVTVLEGTAEWDA